MSTRTDQADVIIIGAGPAGSSCAWRLRRAGLSVLLLDKASFPRDKVCAGWITPGVLRTLEIDAPDYTSNGRVLQPIRAFRTGAMGHPDLLTRYQEPVSYAIRRCEFDAYLAHRSGASLRFGTSTDRIERRAGNWIVNDRFTAPILVGAGGHFCPVARLLNPNLREDAVVAQEIEFHLDDARSARCAIEADVPEIYMCGDFKGYGWCVRKGAYLNVGFGRQDRHGLPAQISSFVEFLAGKGRIPRNLPPKWHGHAYLLYGETRRRLTRDDAVLLVGDAAGMAYAQSGEGIRPAIESGLLAADAIVAAPRRGTQLASEYLRALEARFGPRSPTRPSVPPGLVARLGPRLLRSRWFTRHVLLDRWFLHAHQPVLGEVSP